MRVVLGVSGGIACYKAITLTSLLVKAGVEVQVVLTAHAQEMVQPLPFETLSGQRVITDMFDPANSDPVAHISFAEDNDLLVIAPATANIIAKMAHGIADDFLSTLYLAWTGPVLLAPAMNSHMYRHPAVQANMELLRQRGVRFLAPGEGRLACGIVGIGKMMEPEAMLPDILSYESDHYLKGKRLIVSAGPTREALDPVRFVTNHSSGRMGYAIARAALAAGAEVTLVSGPVGIQAPAGAELIPVESTEAMLHAIEAHFDEADAVVMAAAPSDYRPKAYSEEKIKKKGDTLSLELVKNPDILLTLRPRKNHQVMVGFAAESHRLEDHAREKLERKGLDFIVANDITAPNAGFGHSFNTVTIFDAEGESEVLDTMSKDALAHFILRKVARRLADRA